MKAEKQKWSYTDYHIESSANIFQSLELGTEWMQEDLFIPRETDPSI